MFFNVCMRAYTHMSVQIYAFARHRVSSHMASTRRIQIVYTFTHLWYTHKQEAPRLWQAPGSPGDEQNPQHAGLQVDDDSQVLVCMHGSWHVCVLVFVCVLSFLDMCLYVRVCLCFEVCMYIYIYILRMYVGICMCVDMFANIFRYVSVCTCVSVFWSMYIYIYTYIHTYIHICIYIYDCCVGNIFRCMCACL
jgi:hypothetical protein